MRRVSVIRSSFFCCILAVLTLTAAKAWATAGRLDPTFHAPDGIAVQTRTQHWPVYGEQIVVDDQGRLLVVAGWKLIFRFMPDGSPDTAFGSGGHAALPLQGVPILCGRGMVVQGDGKICILMEAGAERGIIVRLNEDGSPDTTYGPDGRRPVSSYLGAPAVADAIAVQGDGKILIGAEAGKLFRLKLDGSLDTSFGTGGIVTLPGTPGRAGSIRVDPDDDWILAAWKGAHSIEVAKLKPNGDLDPTFTRAVIGGESFDWGKVVLAAGSDRIVVAGTDSSLEWQIDNLVLTCLRADGSRDTSFAGGRIVIQAPIGGIIDATGLEILADGKVLLSGATRLAGECDFDVSDAFVRRYDADGNPDTSFADQGLLSWDRSLLDDFAGMVALQDGSLRLAGAYQQGCLGITDLLLLGLDPLGAPDPAFGSLGLVLANEPSHPADVIPAGLVATPDGGVVVAADTTTGYETPVLIYRYTAEGAVDTSFGTGGSIVTSDPPWHSNAGIIRQGDGKLIVLDSSYDCLRVGQPAVFRLLADGTLDTSFGSGGTFTFRSRAEDYINAGIQDAEGRFVLVGMSGISSGVLTPQTDLIVLRLSPDGVLDTSFGEGGVFRQNWLPTSAATGVALQPDGSILVSGTTGEGEEVYGLVIKLTDAGRLDESFGEYGAIYEDTLHYSLYWQILARAGGGFVVSGERRPAAGGAMRAFAAAFLSDGSPDPSFGNGGIAGFGDSWRIIVRKIDADGRILAAADYDRESGWTYARIWRLLPDGSPDPGFGDLGGFDIGHEGVSTMVTALDIDDQGRVLAGAMRTSLTTREGLLFRLTEQPGIKLLSPRGGERLRSGKSFTITWKPYARSDRSGTVRLRFSTDNGRHWKTFGTARFAAGRFAWTVPRVAGNRTRCRVRVDLLESSGAAIDHDRNPRAFSIAP